MSREQVLILENLQGVVVSLGGIVQENVGGGVTKLMRPQAVLG